MASVPTEGSRAIALRVKATNPTLSEALLPTGLDWRRFCRVPLGEAVPDELMKITRLTTPLCCQREERLDQH